MSIWILLAIVCVAGAIGGEIIGALNHSAFLPRYEKIGHAKILRPGLVGSFFIGALTAGFTWGLYGPFSLVSVLSPFGLPPGALNLTLAIPSLFGALLAGALGAGWLTNRTDKMLMKATTALADGSTREITRWITNAPSTEIIIYIKGKYSEGEAEASVATN